MKHLSVFLLISALFFAKSGAEVLTYGIDDLKLNVNSLSELSSRLGKELEAETQNDISEAINSLKFDNNGTEVPLFNRLLKNPTLWSQSLTLNKLNKELIKNVVASETDYAGSNYVVYLDLGCKKYLATVAGHQNRLSTLLRGVSTPLWYAYREGRLGLADLDGLISSDSKTYQTASGYVRSLLVSDFISQNDIDGVAVLQSHLIKYDDSLGLDDTNVILLQQVGDQFIALEKFLSLGNFFKNDLTRLEVEDLFKIIIAGNLWNLHNNLFINLYDGKIYIFNLEQPNKTRVQDEFLLSSDEIFDDIYSQQIDLQRNVATGLIEFYEILQANSSSRVEYLKDLIKESDIIKSFDVSIKKLITDKSGIAL